MEKNDPRALKTRSLFVETNQTPDESPIYTLRREDRVIGGVTYPSIFKLYLEEGDVTEYEVATKYFQGWDHWKRICSSPAVLPYIEKMREELTMRIRSIGVRAIIEEASKDKPSFASKKYLADGGWVDSKSKAARKKKADIQSQLMNEFEDDLERISKH
jgi:hypothetical protein